MAVIYDYILGRLKVCGLADLITPRMDAVEDAVRRVEQTDVSLLRNQFVFFHAAGPISFPTLVCGEFAQSEPFPVDWTFGPWSHDGLILKFEAWN